ncbi:hypothetical protein ES705_44551 [subsurface metagenome]
MYNVAEVIEQEGEERFTRIPDKLRTTLNESAKSAALSAAGCEIRFNLKSETGKIILKTEQNSCLPIIEVYQGVFEVASQIISPEPTEILISLPQNIGLLDKITKEKKFPFDAYLTRVILPHLAPTTIVKIEGDFALPTKGQTPQTKYIAYGSSITHGSTAIRPTGTYAMRTTQLLGVDLINLGFGGGAHCESQMAGYIAERNDWNFATLELGINMVGGFETDEFKKRVEYFIQKIATAHPEQWIFCIDLFTFVADFDPVSTKQDEFRKIVKETVEKLKMPKVVYLDGREILKNVSGLMGGDLVHPSPEGMEEMAKNLAKCIKKFFKI